MLLKSCRNTRLNKDRIASVLRDRVQNSLLKVATVHRGGLLPIAMNDELQDGLLGLMRALQISGVTLYNQDARIELQKA